MFSRWRFPLYLIPLLALLVAVSASAFMATPAHADCGAGSYYNFILCTAASPGYYADGSSEYPCPVGTYQPYSGQSSCIPASAGYYVPYTAAISQTPCAAGTYNPNTGSGSSSDCQTTPAGSWSGSGYANPILCAVGFFQPNTGASSCYMAAPGYYVNTTGAIAPTPCAIGYFQAGSGQASCNPASQGHFVPNQAMTYQIACSPGSYQGLGAQGNCNLADPGHFAAGFGDITQAPCAVGYYQPSSGAASCNAAAAGNYVPSTGSLAQTPCPVGYYQPDTGQASCIEADAGYYVSTTGATSETQCASGYTSDPGASACVPIDQTPPTITINTPADGATYVIGSAVSADYSCADEAGGSGLASCVGTLANGAAIDTSAVGSFSFTVNAADNVGNPSSLTVHYSVVYNFQGFAAPVDNNILNVAKAGQAIPLKWQLLDANGNPITNLTTVTVKASSLSCNLGTTTDLIEEYATGSSGLQNLGNGYYQFNWASPSSYSKSCKTVTVNMGEGSGASHTVMFQFTK